jgi:acyl dehydratase
MTREAGRASESRPTSLARAADLVAHVGKEFGVSDWHTVDQLTIDRFADATDDHQWIHVDTERAATEMPGGNTIAHGFLVLSMLLGLEAEVLTIEPSTHNTCDGIERLRFTAPVPAGARIRLRRAVAEANERNDGSIRATFDDVIELEGSTRPALVARTVWLIQA